MRLRSNKCEFYKKEVKFLEFIIITEGIKMNQEKVKTVTEWPEPKNLKEVQAFLGFANFYQRFIQDYLKEVTFLTKLTKKENSLNEGKSNKMLFMDLRSSYLHLF